MKKILVVDDESDFREILNEAMAYDKWVVETAENGQVALEKIRLFQPDVIVTDIKMPVMNGLDLLKTCFDSNILIPIIIITGYNDVSKLQTAWLYGAYDLIEKPFTIESLRAVCDGALTFGKDYVAVAHQKVKGRAKVA